MESRNGQNRHLITQRCAEKTVHERDMKAIFWKWHQNTTILLTLSQLDYVG